MVNSLDAPTNANRDYDSPCVTSGTGQTDVRWNTGGLPAGVRGSTQCVVFRSNGFCDRNNVTLDLSEINIGDDDEQDQDKTACHELGHTVGLTHHNAPYSDCMISGERPDNSSQYELYNAHHVGHINDWF